MKTHLLYGKNVCSFVKGFFLLFFISFIGNTFVFAYCDINNECLAGYECYYPNSASEKGECIAAYVPPCDGDAVCDWNEHYTSCADCIAPYCGDGTRDLGEGCDDGPNNGNNKPCGSDCMPNFLGCPEGTNECAPGQYGCKNYAEGKRCTTCGDGRCDYGTYSETKDNCPEDCQEGDYTDSCGNGSQEYTDECLSSCSSGELCFDCSCVPEHVCGDGNHHREESDLCEQPCGSNKVCVDCSCMDDPDLAPQYNCLNGTLETDLGEQCDINTTQYSNKGCSVGYTCKNPEGGSKTCTCVENPSPDSCLIAAQTCKEPCTANTKPIDVYFVMDVSGSMREGYKLQIMKTAFNSIIDSLPVGSRVSLISFYNLATINYPLSNNIEQTRTWNPVSPQSSSYPIANSLTNYVDAFNKLTQVVSSNQNTFGGRNQLVYFFSDGEPTVGSTDGTCTTNHQCQYTAATIEADKFHALFPKIPTIAVALDIKSQHHYILSNHVASSASLFSSISSSVGTKTVVSGRSYPIKSTQWDLDLFCSSLKTTQNPLDKYVDQFCEMVCGPGICTTYTGTYVYQPANNSPTGCLTGTYADTSDTLMERNRTCQGSNGLKEQCSAKKPLTCSQLSVTQLTGSNYRFDCQGIGTNYKINILNSSGSLVHTLSGSSGTYTFQTGGNFTAYCFVDGFTGLICPDTNIEQAIGTTSNNIYLLIKSLTKNIGIVESAEYLSSPQIPVLYHLLHQEEIKNVYTSTCVNPCKKSIVVNPEYYDLALKKLLLGTRTTFTAGDEVTFRIEITNQGTINAQNIQISDYVPVGLILADSAWEYNSGAKTATRTYSSIIRPGESALMQVTFRIDSTVTGKVINYAEISKANGIDRDSTPDNNNTNDCYGGDNIVTGNGLVSSNTANCKPETDEDDHDPAEILVQNPVNPVYDLRIKKDVSAGPYNVGQLIQYIVTLYNTGNSTVSGLVTDVLPLGLSYSGGSTYSFAPTQGGATITAIGGGQRQVSNIAPGQYITIQYNGVIGANASGSLINNVGIKPILGLPGEIVPDESGSCIVGKNPLISDSITNINNAVTGTNNRDCEEITVQPVPNSSYDLRIKKDVSAGPYTSGASITYTVTVLNTGTLTASGKVIDTLPVGLTYTGTEIFSSAKISKVTTGIWMITSLLPNEQVTISYKVVIGSFSGSNKNNVSIFPEGNTTPEVIPYSTGECKNGHNPLVNDFAVQGTNNTDCEEIILSESISCTATAQPDVTIVNSSSHTMNVLCDVKNMTGMVSVDCGNGTTGAMLTKTSAQCTYTEYGSYVATCMVDSVKIAGCNRPITLEKGGGGDPSSICISMTPSKPNNTYYTRKHDADIKCDVDNYSSSDISVDCGNGSIKPGTNVTCEFRQYGSYTIQCLAKGKPVDKCTTSLTLEGNNGGGPNCGDGKRDRGEQCDDGAKNGTPTSLCSKTCTLKVIDPDPGDTPACAFVDPPSIQMGEYVPFWWDLDDELETIQGNNCTEQTVGAVRLDTMECNFTVLAPGGKTYSYIRKCNEDNFKSVKWYTDLQKDLKTKIMPRWGQSVLDSSEWKKSGYGEYAISLEKITYDICTPITSETATGEVTYEMTTNSYKGRVCQFNFAITAPYMMQKGSVFSSLEDDRTVLQAFHQLDGRSILDQRGEKINFMTKTSNTNTFDQVKKLAYDALDQVVSKIDATHPLALIAPVVKKSPREEIYLVEGNVNIAHTSSIGLNRGKATTIIVKGAYTVTINGGLPANLLLIVPEGKVVFNNLDCDSIDVVEGILLAKDFKTTSTRTVLTNTKLDENERCQGGQLIVKGLIVSDNANAFATLRSKRRSTLARRFDDSKTKEEHIYGGASLRIDANANQWDKLPPLAKQTSMVFKLQSKDSLLQMPIYLDAGLLPFYLQMMIAVGEVSELKK